MIARSLTLLVAAVAASMVAAYPGHYKRDDIPVGQYAPPGPNDVRSPCPAFNVLANHGYFPRDGRGLTADMIIEGFKEHLNMDPSVIRLLADAAESIYSDSAFSFGVRSQSEVTSNGTSYINLDDLSIHGPIEHDASLTRLDAPGVQTPQPDLVAALTSRSSDQVVLRIPEVAQYRVDRFKASKAGNQQFSFGAKQEFLAWGESALFISVLGDANHNVPVNYFTEFFLNETFPTGWTKPANPVGSVELAAIVAELKTSVGFYDFFNS